ncbi:hypothetical protein [Acidisoma sp. 7E03]
MLQTENQEAGTSGFIPAPCRPWKRLFPSYGDLDEIAEIMGGCQRSARNLVDKLQVPHIRLRGRRLYDLDDLRRRLLSQAANTAPRGRGRPRKFAA